jgi:hypothetical protein
VNYRNLSCVAVLSAVLISGCGAASTPSSDGSVRSSATNGSGSGPNTPTTAEQIEIDAQNQIADCMKQEGFTYVPQPELGESVPAHSYVGIGSWALPHDEVRQWRAKYGFGNFSQWVYPNDPQVQTKDSNAKRDSNEAIVQGLDSARRKAYNKALMGDVKGTGYDPKEGKNAKAEAAQANSCWGKAEARSTAARSKLEPSKQKQATDRRTWVKFTNDPAVDTAGDAYADCLKQKGYKISRPDPQTLESTLSQFVPDLPDGDATLTPAEAKPKLAQEIKVALDDADCRKPFIDILQKKYPSVANGSAGFGDAVGG